MSAGTRIALERVNVDALSGLLVNSKTGLIHIQDFYNRLGIQENQQYTPAFFLASVSPQSWEPALIAIQDSNQSPVAILYAKERKLLGFRTGLFFADATLGLLIACESHCQKQAFWIGMTTLIANRRVRGLRLLAPPGGEEVTSLRTLAEEKGLEFRTTPTESHMALPLPATYDQFLEVLSSKTRRNFRYYRNRSQSADHKYVTDLSLEEFTPAAWRLESEGPVGGDPKGLQRALQMFGAAAKPLLVGLRSAEGELLSLIGGWHEKDRVVIFMQLNSDKRHARYSLSLVIRGYLIESLIEQGCREIIWWAGVGEPISHYCKPVPTTWAYLDSPSLSWRLSRRLIDRFRNRLPVRLREIAEWVVPPSAAHRNSPTTPSFSAEPE